MSLAERMSAGERVFNQTCMACHQSNGQGIPGVFPPLAKSDYMMEDLDRAIETVIQGKQGEITVNGQKYNKVMTPQNLNDQEIANVLSFVMSSWGNSGEMVSSDQVAKVRETLK